MSLPLFLAADINPLRVVAIRVSLKLFAFGTCWIDDAVSAIAILSNTHRNVCLTIDQYEGRNDLAFSDFTHSVRTICKSWQLSSYKNVNGIKGIECTELNWQRILT